MARIGSNPEKLIHKQLNYKLHRVIMPFYIPNTTENFYKESVAVLDLCLKSLTETINHELTNITLINNASCNEAHNIAKKYVEQGLIDRYIICKENRGKVGPCLSEVRSSFEDFVTIADADVYFFNGWENAVFEIFENIPRAGAVCPTPMPNLAFNCNSSLFIQNLFTKKAKKEVAISKEDLMLFAEGIGSDEKFYFSKKDNHNWIDSQFIYTENEIKACVGCGHFVTTSKRTLIEKRKKERLNNAMTGGLEYDYLDSPIDIFGYYRLSTIKSYVYHMGNIPPTKEFIKTFEREKVMLKKDGMYEKKTNKFYLIPYWIRVKLFQIIKNIYT